MAGSLVIEDETDLLAGYETHLLVLKDIALSGPDPAPYTMMSEYMHGKEGDVVMVYARSIRFCRQGQGRCGDGES